MRHREAAELEIGIQRLDVAQDRVAGGGIAVVADRGAARQPVDHLLIAEIVADRAKAAMRVELVAVERDDAGRFLAAVLQRVQAERGHRGGVGMAEDAEYAALLVQPVVVVERSGGQHAPSRSLASRVRWGSQPTLSRLPAVLLSGRLPRGLKWGRADAVEVA